MLRKYSFLVTFFVALALMLGVLSTANAECVGGSPDGVWEPDEGEECDAGLNGLGCDDECQIVSGYECSLDIDFSKLSVTEYTSNDASWDIGTFEAEQTKNTVNPTFAYFNANAKAKVYNIGMSVNQTTYDGEDANGDDDFIGFVLGFDPSGYASDPATKYLLIDWKAREQRTASGPNNRVYSPQGLRLSYVEGQPTLGNSGSSSFWVKSDQRADSKIRHLEWASGYHENESTAPGAPQNPPNPTYGNTGWDNLGQTYIFTIDYSDNRLLVKVRKDKAGANQETVFDVAAADFLDDNNDPLFPNGFPSGEIAFYGLSQAKVVYSLGHDIAGGDRTSVCEGECGDGLHVEGEECDGQAGCNQDSCHWVVSVDSDDFVTYASTPAIVGEGSVGGSVKVVIRDANNDVVDTVTAIVDGDGEWSATPNNTLPPGEYTFEVEQQDAKLAKTTASGSFSIVALTLDTPVDNAVFGGPSFVNNDYKVPVSGTGIPGTTVIVTADATSPGVSVVVDANGNWVADLEIPGNGPHTIQANSVDEQGHDADEQEINITIDLGISVAIDSPADGSTVSEPVTTITGTGKPGAHIEVTIGSETLATTVAQDGSWSVTPANPLTNGVFTVEVETEDALGNTGSDQSTFTVHVNACDNTNNCDANATCIDLGSEGLYDCECNPGYVGDGFNCNPGVSAVDDNLYLYVDGSRKFDPLANDTNYDASTFELLVLPQYGTITGPGSDGYYTYTVNEGFVGNDTATYKICDGIGVDASCDTAVLHIYIYDFSVAIDTPAHGSEHSTAVTEITGTGEVGEDVVVTIEDGETITTTVDGNGNWSVELTTPLTNDTFTATATIKGAYGTVQAESTFTVHVNACEEGTFICGPNFVCEDAGSGGNYNCVCAPGFILVGSDCVAAPQVTIDAPGDGEIITTGTPDIFGTANPNSPVEVFIDGVSIGTTTSDSDGEWTLTPDDWTDQPATPLEDGDYEISATVTTDSGDASDKIDVTVNTDVCGEDLNSCELNSTCEDYGNGVFDCVCDEGYVNDADELCALAPYVTINAPADGSVIRTTTPTLRGNANPNSTVEISIDGAVVGTATTDADGNWTFTVPTGSELSEGDGPYIFTATTSVGDVEAEDTTTLYLDSSAHVIIETPHEGDEVSTTPTVKGSAIPNAEITIVIRGEELGTTTADENGQWKWTAPDELESGPAEIVAIDKDNDEQDSVNVLIGDIESVVIVTPEDGSSTTNPTPPVSGTGEPNTDVTISVDGDVVVTVPVDENGNWTWTPEDDLTPGEHILTAEGVGGSEDEVTVTITKIPTVITTPDDGSSADDTTPTVTGTAEPNTDVTIIVDGENVGTVPVDEDGNWTWTPEDELTPGEYPIKAVGENGTEDEITITVTDGATETAVKITGPADGSTSDGTSTVTGTGEPNTDITIVVDGKDVGTVPVDENGNWTWTPDTPLEDGQRTIEARGEDGSSDSITLHIGSDIQDQDGAPDSDVALTGGRFLSCASAGEGAASTAWMLLAAGLALMLRRRRTPLA